MMPPHTGDQDGIARCQFNDLGRLKSLTKFWEALIVGRIKVDQANRLSGRRDVQGADIEIVELIRWEQNKASAPGDRTGNVSRKIIVCGDAALIADPDTDYRILLREI